MPAIDPEDALLSAKELAEKQRLKKIENHYRGTVIDDERLPTRIRHLLSIHGIGDVNTLMRMKADDFMSLWGLGWGSWKIVIQYKWIRSEEDGVDYFRNDGSKVKWKSLK